MQHALGSAAEREPPDVRIAAGHQSDETNVLTLSPLDDLFGWIPA